MNIPLSNIVSVSDLQRDYRKIINKAKKTKMPVVVMRGNEAEVVVMDAKVLENLNDKVEELELEAALQAIEIAEKELKEGKLTELPKGGLEKLLNVNE